MKVDLKQIEQLYNLYVHIRKSSLPERKQYNLIRALLVGEVWSWRVVGISENALYQFAKNDFKKVKNKIDRHHHIKSFAEYSKRMREETIPMGKWWKLVYENEEVLLVTKEEHRSGTIENKLDIDFDRGLFRNNPSVSFRYRKEEREFLRKLAKDNGIWP